MLKKILIGVATLLLLCMGAIAIFASYLNWSTPENLTKTTYSQLPYLAGKPAVKGKVLAIVTSTPSMQVPTKDGFKTKEAGFELTELARAYAVFIANGYDVDVASPLGGAATYVQDEDDMGAYDYAFLNDSQAMNKVRNTLKISNVSVEDYAALYLVGGKGTMFDFRNNASLQRLISESWSRGAVVSAVCHGPAALLGVALPDGSQLLAGKQITGFSNAEELLLIPKAEQVFGSLLEDELRNAGAKVVVGPDYLEQIAIDGRLISGQNPWSVWALADAVVAALGETPAPRELTGEELAVNVMGIYQQHGLEQAVSALQALSADKKTSLARNLIAIHIFVSAKKGQWSEALDQFELLRVASRLADVG